MSSDVLGVAAALLQVVGYGLYIRNFLTESIRPNAASSFMFAYGTALLVFLEWENAATWQVLALPVACAVMSIVVALLCLRSGATEPIDNVERGAFTADLALTIAYATLVLGWVVAPGYAVTLLILGNITTVTAFFPLLRSTWRTPERERPLPWLVWTGAYLLLFAATVAADRFQNPVLLVYPALNIVFHALIAAFSVRHSSGGRRYFGPGGGTVFHGPSPIHGTGLFSAKGFAKGDHIWTMNGKTITRSPTSADPDFVGIAPGVWVDPALPVNRLNHSCAPNAAFRADLELYALREIAEEEEITLDYSTTECDPAWEMDCACRAPGCRLGLFAIQISFADAAEPPPASPMMQQVWQDHRMPAPHGPAFPQLAPDAQPAAPGTYIARRGLRNSARRTAA